MTSVMVLFSPLLLVLVALVSTLAGIAGLSKTYDSDFYLPGGVSFDPRGQNRQLVFACLMQIVAWSCYTVWVVQRLNLLVVVAPQFLSSRLSAAMVGLPYALAMFAIVRVGRHLGRFSDLRMTRPDGSEILPIDLMRPLSLAANAYAALAILVPLLIYLQK